jgi:hypothetical protein
MRLFRVLLLLFILSFIKLTHANSCSFPKNVQTAFAKLSVKLNQTTETDYGKHYASSNCYLEAWPTTTIATAKLVLIAYQYHIPIRTQGRKHSQNGSALPKQAELLIHTNLLNTIAFEKAGSIQVGAGVPVALINPIISNQSHLFIPIYNGGGIGPSVGGYIAAGGISPDSATYGGFWEHVNTITLVTAHGRILHLKRKDPAFIWLFGSMGQLGIITAAELQVLSLPAVNTIPYPTGRQLIVNSAVKTHEEPTIFWFNIFADTKQQTVAENLLKNLQKEHSHALRYFPIYHWKIAFKQQNPPLLFDRSEDFYAIGSWGLMNQFVDSKTQIQLFEQAFTQQINQQHLKRYIQAELTASPTVYQAYFSPSVYAQFKAFKKRFDPEFLFNRGSVFATE